MLFNQKENTLKCYGRIFGGDGVYFQHYFDKMQSEYDDITIRLHTNGGSVIDGNLIFNEINKSNKNVEIIIDGLAASMGSIIMMSSKPPKIVENGFVMLHAPSGGANGTAKDLRNTATLLEDIEENFIEKIIERTKISVKDAKALMIGDNWFSAKKALKLGLVGEIIPAKYHPKVPITAPEQMGSLEVFNAYAGLLTDIPTSNNSKFTTNMKQKLITAFALMAVTAESSDTAVIEALTDKLNDLKNAKEKAEQTTADFKTKLATETEKQVTAIVEAHAKQNDITDEKKQVLVTIGKTSGIDALMAVLDTKPSKSQFPDLNALLQKGTGGEIKANWDWDKWQKEDPRGLEALAKTNAEAYNKLYNEKYKS